MTQAIIKFGKEQEQIVNTVKGLYGLKNKSDTVNMIISKFAEESLEPKILPEYSKKLLKIAAGPHIAYDSMDEFFADIRKEAKILREAEKKSNKNRKEKF